MKNNSPWRLVVWILLLLAPGMQVHAQEVPFELTDGTPVAFVNVTVIPMDRMLPLIDHTVTVDDGLITNIGPDGSVTIPDGAVVIDGVGRFLVPGLVDLHTHLGAEVGVAGGIGENQAEVYLAKGVTTILNQGDFLVPFGNGLISLARRIRNGEMAGPTIYTASYARGPADTGTPQQIVDTYIDGREHVIASKAAGYDYIKVYNQTPLAAFDGIVDQSRIENMAVIGHFPHPVGTAKALADGMAMVAHAWAYVWTHFGSSHDPSLIVPAINQTLNAGAWVNTTLYVTESVAAIWGGNQAAFNALLAKPQMRYVHPAEIGVWRDGFEGPRWSPSGSRPGTLDSEFAFVKRYTRDFYDAGIRLTLGTDSPTVLGAPGFSTHEEMRVLGQLGLSNFEILTIATRNPGEFIDETLPNAEPFGTIEVAKRADLLLLDSDPLADLTNLQRTVGVMARGRWYSRESLDGRLEAVAAEYASITPPRPPPTTTGGGGGALDIYSIMLLFLGIGKNKRRAARFVSTAKSLALLLLLQACGSDVGPGDVPMVQTIETPVQTNDGWETASLAEVGIDAQPIIDAVNRIRSGAYNEIHGFVIVKDGRLVLEEYGSGRMFEYGPPDNLGPTVDFDRDELHIVHSVSKSYVSTLVGIAIQEGYITSEDASLLTFFPEHADPNQPGKAEILLKHVMSMSSGLEWNEWDVGVMDFANNDAYRYQTAHDPCAYFLRKDLLHEPGTSFYYNTGGFQMMGEVIRRATAMPVNQFAVQHIFDPLEITDYYWPQIEHGPVYIVGDLFLRPRDIAKFGQLILQGGQWNGQQIVPAGWFEKATSESISVAHTGYKGYSGYGFHWWLKTFNIGGESIDAIHADGLAGQAIMVFPTLDLVVVVTSGNYNQAELEHALVANHVLPAVIN